MNKIKFGLVGLIFVLIGPALDWTMFVVFQKSYSEKLELSNQAFKEEFGEGPFKLDDPRLQQFQESQTTKPNIFQIIGGKFLYWMIYYISPAGGIIFGIISLFKDKKSGKLLGILSILGALYLIYAHLLAAAFSRMI